MRAQVSEVSYIGSGAGIGAAGPKGLSIALDRPPIFGEIGPSRAGASVQRIQAATVAARQLATIARRVGASLALDDTLDAVANAVVETLGFRAAVVNLTGPDGDVHVVAVAGSAEVQDALMGTSSPRPAWDAMLASATPWGAL